MSITESKKKRISDVKLFLCYNCGIEIIDRTQKNCPNCHVILNPNDYINWKISWYGFIFSLWLISFLIVILVVNC